MNVTCKQYNIKKQAICTICGWLSSDLKNKTGSWTKHLKNIHNIADDVESNFKIIDYKKSDIFKCPMCDWQTSDIKNRSGVITSHIIKQHQITVSDFCNKYNNCRELFVKQLKKELRDLFLNLNDENRIRCEICNKYFKKLSNTHLKSHGITPTVYKQKYNIYSTNSIRTGKLQSTYTCKLNTTHNLYNRTSNYEIGIADILTRLNINFIKSFLYNGKKFDFYIPHLNMVLEIDGDFFHPIKLEKLTIKTINNTINDFEKDNLMQESPYKFHRIRYNKNHNITTETEFIKYIENASYKKDYRLNGDQVFLEKEYLRKYIAIKSKDDLIKYVPLIYKFIKTFHATFPLIQTSENLKDVINKIQTYDMSLVLKNDTFIQSCWNVGTSYLKSNFKSYWKSHFNNKSSPVNAWEDTKIMLDIIKYRIGCNASNEIFDISLNEIINGLKASRYTISFFKPLLASAIYKHYLGGSKSPTVLDPCCGFGARLLGFKSIYPDGTYIGCEPNSETYCELMELIKNGKFSNVKIFNCKFEDYTDTMDVDLTFTSIPYFDTEIYSKHIYYENFNAWENTFISKITKCKSCYINTTIGLGNQLGWNNIDKYIKLKRSHFDKTRGYKQEAIFKI